MLSLLNRCVDWWKKLKRYLEYMYYLIIKHFQMLIVIQTNILFCSSLNI